MTARNEDFMDIDDAAELAQISNQLAYARQQNPFQMQKSAEFYRQGKAFEPLPSNTTAIFVLDTNFLISHLSTISLLRQLSHDWGHLMIIPYRWAVIQELDGLNGLHSGSTYANSKGADLQTLARSAINQDNSIRGQRMTDVIDTNLSSNDDAILDCCRYWAERTDIPIWLLTSDTNLRVKAMVHSIGAVNPLNLSAIEILAQAFRTISRSSSVSSIMQVDTRTEIDTHQTKRVKDITMSYPSPRSDPPEKGIYSSKWAPLSPRVRIQQNKYSPSASLAYSSLSMLQSPFDPRTARDPILSSLFRDINQTITTVSTPYLRHQATKSFGGELGASWIFSSTPNPKNFDDVVRILTKSYFTTFSDLFPRRKGDRGGRWILTLSECLNKWLIWAECGVGEKPQKTEMIVWLNDVFYLWQGLASGIENREQKRGREETVIGWQQSLDRLWA
ncbi:Transcriptional protein swt1 [Neolecta irregularis DAH-3]|uniref:Transcriptional protein swt1 n=1 Tax=Neolecta irregularis (strain DAH-3) TaxID=1198029 RepID=A0A1U7LQN9_NEOID|nr:Transcriptional protein swt1 [Neolecta irregularis DAH-3]|eukprot:OLL24975.1 Transcriptional protein swt1 [Neolecta irregularis DAH-3]